MAGCEATNLEAHKALKQSRSGICQMSWNCIELRAFFKVFKDSKRMIFDLIDLMGSTDLLFEFIIQQHSLFHIIP